MHGALSSSVDFTRLAPPGFKQRVRCTLYVAFRLLG